jgi:hypothetical protein
LVRESKINPKKPIFDLKKDMQLHGINMHVSTIRYHILRKTIRPAEKKTKTLQMKKKCLAWVKKYQHWTFEEWKKIFLR